MRRRLRPTPDKAALDQMYAAPHQHGAWADHRVRVDVTTAIAQHMIAPGGVVADLSCGDGAIARRLQQSHGVRLILGDYAPGYDICGPIEDTIEQLDEPVELFILSETLEHLDDPDKVLRQIRSRAANLILSTPDGEDDDRNPEHVWGWSSDDVRQMVAEAGWEPLIHTLVDFRPGFVYCYQIWALR